MFAKPTPVRCFELENRQSENISETAGLNLYLPCCFANSECNVEGIAGILVVLIKGLAAGGVRLGGELL